MTETNYNRWHCVYGAVLLQLCLGVVYIWSIFRTPIEKMFGWSTSDVSLAFTINLAMIPIMMIAGGYLTPKMGVRKVAILGGVMVLTGMYITSKTSSLWMLWLGYGFLTGGGVGVAYGVPIATLVKWFPDKRGLITGLAVGSLGFGSVLFTQVGYYLMTKVGVMDTFSILGIMIFVGVILGALLIKAAPDGYTPPGWTPPPVKAGQAGPSKYDFTPREMLGTPHYYFLFIMYTFANVCALIIIAHASPIGQKVANLTPAEATTIVSLLGLFNSVGRLFWGAVSDKLGRLKSIFAMFVLSAIAMFSMNYLSSYWLYALGVSIIGFCFGGTVGVFPSITADTFGPKYVGVNYGLILLAYAVGGIIGPIMAAWVKEFSGGEYYLAFIISGSLCLIGAIMAMTFKAPKPPVIGEQKSAAL
ncbi:L-lactate MFS transporter [Sporomusa termitida]|uniref:Putative MFS-type transporter YhjX n=1 Tax=Sporomusa termitida TaxID=2377 RepID=A0A517E1J0_9FIRM|nr:OFA family MFS transporter [Sporomusa termitida]QDR83469.1 putative MFS-type transporter YhjX [Sporomusa termitida]